MVAMSTTLRAEIKQSAPFASLEQEAFLQVLRTAGVLEHAVAEGLKPYGLTQRAAHPARRG